MMRTAICVLRLGFAVLTLMPLAYAGTIGYNFTVAATSGPLNGTVASGTFSYDSSSIVLGGSNLNTGLLTAFNFTWDGITYDKTTANTGSLHFDGSGNLNGFLFGNNCGAGFCSVLPSTEGFDVGGLGPPGIFDYARTGVSGVFSGTVSSSQAPEPSTLVFLSAGLLGLTLAAVRRRQLGLQKP